MSLPPPVSHLASQAVAIGDRICIDTRRGHALLATACGISQNNSHFRNNYRRNVPLEKKRADNWIWGRNALTRINTAAYRWSCKVAVAFNLDAELWYSWHTATFPAAARCKGACMIMALETALLTFVFIINNRQKWLSCRHAPLTVLIAYSHVRWSQREMTWCGASQVEVKRGNCI